MFVHDYMTPNPVMVDPDMTFPEATSLMRKRKIRRLPVVDHDQLIGIVSEEDLLSNQPSPATTLSIHEMYGLLERLRVRQMMSRPVFTVEGDCPVEEAARIMVDHKVGCLPVMEGDKLVGIITETDIFKVLVEVLGGQEGGSRISLLLPEKVGMLAKVVSGIAEIGGNILAVVATRLLGDLSREVMIKERGADPDVLYQMLCDSGGTILDIRPTARYQPRMFG